MNYFCGALIINIGLVYFGNLSPLSSDLWVYLLVEVRSRDRRRTFFSSPLLNLTSFDPTFLENAPSSCRVNAHIIDRGRRMASTKPLLIQQDLLEPNKINKIKQYVPQSSSLGERFTSRASAGESCKTYYHLGRSVSPLDAHVLKEDRPSHWAKSP